jgi:ribosomal protein L11 methyltransferase
LTVRRVSIRVGTDEAERTRAVLLELAPDGFEEAEHGAEVELAVYADRLGELALREALGTRVDATDVPDGWEDAWRAFHRPARAGGLWIGPPWETPPPGDPAVVIDPGLAFGTGAHPTTRLCVELLAAQPRGSLLDVGCGSGVLAIAAARLGFAPVSAVDDDPVAVEVARENARVNGVVLDARVLDATAEALPRADVAVANIALDDVEAILPRLHAERAVTSGYLPVDRPSAPGWAHGARLELDGWAADAFTRTRDDRND